MFPTKPLVLYMNSFIEENKNKYLQMDGLKLLLSLPHDSVDLSIQDYQYREILDNMDYGNKDDGRQKARVALAQMSTEVIISFLKETAFVLKPSAYVFLWVDKFILCEGLHLGWLSAVNDGHKKPILNMVDMITWDKGLIGQGYRSRRQSEHLLIIQKTPKTIKTWKDRSIPDSYSEKILLPRTKGLHPHRKPVGLIKKLIESVTEVGDLVLDPCAGSFSTFSVCDETGRDFIGCDLTLEYVNAV